MINRTEKKWIWYAAILLIVFTTIPYAIAYLRAGQDWRFSGFLFGVEDGNSYIAKMLSGTYGEWLFKTPYTSMTQHGFLAFLPYILLGKLAAGKEIHEQLVGLFQFYRWIGIYCYILGSYTFVSLFVEKIFLRRLGTALCVAGGGLGWLYIVGANWFWQDRLPLEFYSPESFGFLSVFGLPHLAMARGLLLLGIGRFIRSVDEQPNRVRQDFAAAISFVLIGFMQPMTVLVGWMIICMYWLVKAIQRYRNSHDQWKHLVLDFINGPGFIIFISSPMVIYTIISFQLDPFLRGWAAQNKILSPPIGDYLLAYAIAIISLVYYVWNGRGNLSDKTVLLLLWVFLLPLLAYFPYNLQRRLPEGIWTAFAVFIVLAFQLSTGWEKKIFKLLIISSFLSTIFFFAGSLISSSQPASPLYLTRPESDILNELGKVSRKGDVVFADFQISNSIPAWIPVTVIIGHGPESVNQVINNNFVTQILNGKYPVEDTCFFLQEQRVKYILVGGPDPKFTNTSLTLLKNCLVFVKAVDDYSLYEFVPPCQ